MRLNDKKLSAYRGFLLHQSTAESDSTFTCVPLATSSGHRGSFIFILKFKAGRKRASCTALIGDNTGYLVT